MAIFYAIIVLLLSINFALGFHQVIDLVQTKVSAENIPNNQVLTIEAAAQLASKQNISLIPQGRGLPVPEFSATAVLVKDIESGTVLFEKDVNKRVPIASTTKIMTALIASKFFKPYDVLTVSESAMVEGSSMGLQAGEKLTLRSLLYGMLLNSGNDAAYTIASNFSGGLPLFIQAMNNQAQALGLQNTHFDNPAGFDSPSHYSSASDLAIIAGLAIEDPQLARIVSTKETSVASIDKHTIHPLKNLNKLLDTPGVLGVKTGYTPEAKENLVGLTERDGHKILTVVLGSEDRFGETRKFIEWTYANFDWK